MKRFKVSIIIPTFKRIKDLNKCLDSIKKQTVSPKEIIIADNANDINTKNVFIDRKNEFNKNKIGRASCRERV